MEQSPSSEAHSHSASQRIPHFISNLMIHYHVHNSTPLILSCARWIQSPRPISLRSTFNTLRQAVVPVLSALFCQNVDGSTSTISTWKDHIKKINCNININSSLFDRPKLLVLFIICRGLYLFSTVMLCHLKATVVTTRTRYGKKVKLSL
jgi:hypothetical protein